VKGVIAAGVAVVVAGSVWIAYPRHNRSDAGTTNSNNAQTATAQVRQTTLTARDDVDGTLGYAGDVSVTNRLQGTVTWVPDVGAVIQRGGVLYTIDNKPVTLFYGAEPAWRALDASATDGTDILQLETNLVALGYDPNHRITVDDHFDAATTAAVKRWQKALGEDQTGSVDPTRIVFLPGAIRVTSTKLTVGAPAQPGPALETSTTTRVVTVHLPTSQQHLARAGEKVEVELPDGSTTPGTVLAIGTVATAPSDQSGNSEATIDVTVVLTDPKAAGTLDQAPVTVRMTSDEHPNVLAVPVGALLAQAGGGYAVETVEAGTHRLVPVQVGLFADGQVEITGAGVHAGMTVVVPQ
jgi:peptidoglycan hydrolase-like protein with peptidoglycan-binding domain